MNKKQLQEDIKDMQAVVDDKDTPADIKSSIEPALVKAKQQLKELEDEEDKPKRKVVKKTAAAKPAPVKKQATVKKMPVRKAVSIEKRKPMLQVNEGKRGVGKKYELKPEETLLFSQTLTIENCKKLLAQYKKRKSVASKTAAKRKASGKPEHLTAGEALARVSDQMEDKVQYSVNKSGRLLKTDLNKSQSEIVDIVATLLAGIPDKKERESFLRELISQLNDLKNEVQPLQRADLGAIIGDPNNYEWLAGGELFEKGGTVKSKLPAHFGSGENFEILGYKTRNFDICGKAVEKIKNVAQENNINLNGTASTLREHDFRRSVEMLDTFFGIEKSVIAVREAGAGTMKNAANAAMIAQTYLTEAFGLSAGLFEFTGMHLYEISKYIKKKNHKAGGTIESQLFAQGGTITDIKESKLKSAVELLTAHDDRLMFWKYIGEANYTGKNEAVFLKAFLPSGEDAYVLLAYYPEDGDYSYRLMGGDTTSEFNGIEGFITSWGYNTIDEIREEMEEDLTELNRIAEKNAEVEYEDGGIAGAAAEEIGSPTGGAGVYARGGRLALADIGEEVAEFVTDIYPKVRVRTFTYKDNQFINLVSTIGNADATQVGKIYDDKESAIKSARKYAEKNSTDGFNVEQKFEEGGAMPGAGAEDALPNEIGGGDFEKGGRLKSAVKRDRKYKSDEPHEKKYKRKSSPKNPHYKKVEKRKRIAVK